MLNPVTINSFIDELESNGFYVGEHTKQALYGKAWQKGMDVINKGIHNAAEAGFKSKNKGIRNLTAALAGTYTNPDNVKLMNDMSKGLQEVGPDYMLATLKGEGARRVVKPAIGTAADKLTWEYKNSPFAQSLLQPVSSTIDSAYAAGGEGLSTLSNLLKLASSARVRSPNAYYQPQTSITPAPPLETMSTGNSQSLMSDAVSTAVANKEMTEKKQQLPPPAPPSIQNNTPMVAPPFKPKYTGM